MGALVQPFREPQPCPRAREHGLHRFSVRSPAPWLLTHPVLLLKTKRRPNRSRSSLPHKANERRCPYEPAGRDNAWTAAHSPAGVGLASSENAVGAAAAVPSPAHGARPPPGA